MAVSQASMKLIKIVERFELEVLNAGKNYERCLIREDDINRPALQICGTKSGRDTDKIAESGLTPVELDGVWGFQEALRVLKLKKLFVADMEKEHFLDQSLLKNYPTEDYHRVYVYEIETVYEKV